MPGGWFIVVDHQVLEKVKKPRWQVSEERTGQLRILAKVGSGVAPICTVLLVMQYRLCIANFEEAGGVAMQTWLLVLLSSQSKEVQMPWGTLWFLLAGLLQAIVAITALRGPLRKPERPLALDVIDIQMEQRPPPAQPSSPRPQRPTAGQPPSSPRGWARLHRSVLIPVALRGHLNWEYCTMGDDPLFGLIHSVLDIGPLRAFLSVKSLWHVIPRGV
ncbi:unnamed protein product [Effrenium voratum]|uniref:Uncharacterized protein n=1 Tax=Effrenium voratum TaxID=2562239 RepID=A0AA36JLL9_9DINO|nr:unnamed protein product [Effrenium voratum]